MKYNLRDCTFTIPFQYEYPDRLRNLQCVVSYILHHFDTKVIVAEHGESPTAYDLMQNTFRGNVDFIFEKGDKDLFPKTKLLNLMASQVKTQVMVSQDADVIFDTPHYINAYNAVRNGNFDFVFPHNRGTVNIPDEKVEQFKFGLNINTLGIHQLIEAQELLIQERGLNCPQGGCLFMRTSAFWDIGGEDEIFNCYSTEDAERYQRIVKLNARYTHLTGMLLHLHHQKTPRSTHENGHWETGWKEYQNSMQMSKDELINHVKNNFTWLKKYGK